MGKQKRKKIKRALKNTFLIISVAAAGVMAVVTFMGMASMDLTGKQFVVNAIMFLVSVEYIYLFLYANEVFMDQDRVVLHACDVSCWGEIDDSDELEDDE